jgi:hypothetical protein
MVTKIIKGNLVLMNSLEDGGMKHYIYEESMNGNADSQGKHPCVAANFFYDLRTGKMFFFEAIQHLPSKFKADKYLVEGIFVVELVNLLFDKPKMAKITEVHASPKSTPLAEATIKKTVKLYNEVEIRNALKVKKKWLPGWVKSLFGF